MVRATRTLRRLALRFIHTRGFCRDKNSQGLVLFLSQRASQFSLVGFFGVGGGSPRDCSPTVCRGDYHEMEILEEGR